ncbi:MAG: LysR family transcriptional regulator [Phormidesmis sp. RL_2_1]|nr:LysR family transcriptional regulator [Phormidesmis sp. RL_2_1]
MTKADGQLKISQLVALVAVAEQGGFSAAALQLGLAQSTVSHAIATLESDLGVVLLLRNRVGATLTPIGSEIYQQARAVLDSLAEIQQTAQQAKEMHIGRVRVAAVRTVATHILPDAIARFRQQYPQMSVEIAECDRYAEAEQALRAGKADLGFTLLPTSVDFQAWELFREEFVALLPPLATAIPSEISPIEQPPLTWSELLNYSRVANTRSIRHNNLVEQHLARFGYEMPIVYEVREDSTLMGLIEKGLGAAVLTRLEAEPVPAGVRVRSLPEPLERVVGIATLERAILPRAVFAFLDVLLALP